MSSKNKEKSSFWKKLVGKNKSSISSLKSDTHYDKHDNTIKNKNRLSSKSLQPPIIQQPSVPSTPIPSQQPQQQQQQQKGTMTTVPSKASVDTSPVPTPTIATTNLSQNKLIIDTNDVVEPVMMPQPEANEKVKQTKPVDSIEDTSKDDLLLTISNLKSELDEHKATVQVLQKQKEAVTKDLDYLELTVDELLAEKNDLIQQLEDEKIKSQHHLDDLNTLLTKMKSTADHARDQSFINNQTKQELENLQLKSTEEKETLLTEIKQKDKSIRELKSKLNKSRDETKALKATMEQLVQTQAEELNRITKLNEENELKIQSLLNTPHPPSDKKGAEDDHSSIHSTPFRTPKTSIEYIDDADLDDQLMKLTKEKEKLQSYYSKIPLSGGGPKARRRKEELESMLDHVDSQLSKVKQRIKKT